ncbi:MAG: serine hydrolase [Clostridia bacterium]|nr:serine hydrolase [Clostridia bacterium]
MKTINDNIVVTPESQGLDSEKVVQFLQIVKRRKINLHSFLLARHGKILAEGYFPPFNRGFKHRIYSSSKTFVALAIGKAIGEGKIRLSDKLVDFFPEYQVEERRKWLKQTTVEDALKMSVPILTDSYAGYDGSDWAWTFFNLNEDLKPSGTVFNYNTSGTFILNVIIEKTTGMPFLEYLRPVFERIGVADDIWCVQAPDGFSRGGSGVVITLRDFAKVGELLMHRGAHKGEQLIPLDFMVRATSVQISNLFDNNYTPFMSSGYGYHVWINECGWGMYGMGSQLAFCFPKKDLLFVCQGDTQSSNDICPSVLFDLVQQLFYETMQKYALPENPMKHASLVNALNNLQLNVEYGKKHSPLEKNISGVKYLLNPNPMGWKWFRLEFLKEEGVLTYENARGEKSIKFGLGKFVKGKFPETHYYDKVVGKPANRELNALFSANWLEEKKLLIRNYIIDVNMGNCFMTFSFKGNEVGLCFNKQMEFSLQDYQGFGGGYQE